MVDAYLAGTDGPKRENFPRCRLNITLSEELVRQMGRIAGPRKKSQFIAEAVREKIQKIRRKETAKPSGGGL